MRLSLAGLLLPLMFLAGPASAADGPEIVAKAFCEARMKDDETATRKLLTPSLLKVIDEAEARNKVIQDATPGEKPPFGDGIPYQSYQDQPTACEIGAMADVSGHKEIEVRYSFDASPGANWTDKLELVEGPDGFRIDDILFIDVANGVSNQGLRRVLFEAFDQ